MMRFRSGCSGRPPRSAVRCTWSIGSSPPSTKTKNSSGKRRAEADHHLASAEALPPGETGDVEAGAVDELLEHQRVLRLLDDLVVGVAKLGRAVRQPQRELEQPALEHALELQRRSS